MNGPAIKIPQWHFMYFRFVAIEQNIMFSELAKMLIFCSFYISCTVISPSLWLSFASHLTFLHTLKWKWSRLQLSSLREWYVRSVQVTYFVYLQVIEKDSKSDVDRCFVAVLTHWLSTQSPTWNQLVEALRSKPVDYLELARRIEEQYRL